MADLMLSQLLQVVSQAYQKYGDMPVGEYSWEAGDVMRIEDDFPRTSLIPPCVAVKEQYPFSFPPSPASLVHVANVEESPGKHVTYFMLPSLS